MIYNPPPFEGLEFRIPIVLPIQTRGLLIVGLHEVWTWLWILKGPQTNFEPLTQLPEPQTNLSSASGAHHIRLGTVDANTREYPRSRV